MTYPTQQPPPAPPPPPRRRSGWVRSWTVPAVIGGVLVLGVLLAAGVFTGPLGSTRTDGTAAAAEASGLDEVLQPAASDAASGPLGKGRRGARLPKLAEGEKVVAGSVSSFVDNKLVVRKDNGVDVTVPTNADTKVRGTEGKALTDLKAGQRVIVKVGSDGVADGVLVVRAHAAGTVIKLDGDRATVIRPNGLSVVLDLSGVSQRPAVGTVVVAVGTAADDNSTIKVTNIRELPTLG
jgi:hypothetical protein